MVASNGRKLAYLNIEYSKRAVKYINSADRATKKCLRVGDLRVLFTMEIDAIYIDDIAPRGQVYKRL